MLDWAQNIQAGTDWLGKHSVQKGRVMYVMAEGQFGLKGRLEAWETHYQTPIPEYVLYHIEGVSFWTPQGRDNPGADAIVMAAAAVDTDVLFIDTMAATFGGGDENRQQDMNLWLDPLRELRRHGISVVVAHHANRSQGAIRGSSVLGGEADTIIEMKPKYNEDNPGVVDYVTVVNQKQKDFVPFVPFRMDLISVPLEPSAGGLERSGPLLVYSKDAYEGKAGADGRRLTAVTRRGRIREQIIDAVRADPGLSWRKLRDLITGKNVEKQAVRDEMLVAGLLEYDGPDGGYTLGPDELLDYDEYMAEMPPLLGESEEE
jgi:hypothetical protein